MKRYLLLALCCLVGVACASEYVKPKVKLGNEVLIERRLGLLKGKRVGLIVNHTARLSSGEFLVDALIRKGVNVVALFGPEHGIRGEAAAGEHIANTKDEKSGVPIFSLYGKTRKPTSEMLTGIDVLVYDIQDVGVRFYTYISTMGLCMEAAAEKRIPFVVLDRPNPLGGQKVEGPIIDDSLKSFVGMYSLPVVYGLTCGELATMINGQGWLTQIGSGLPNAVTCELVVVSMEGWRREMVWDDTGCNWIPPSPNIKTSHAALVYPATCLVEGTNLSEGRGTENPFQYVGAPFISSGPSDFLSALSSNTKSMRFKSATFTPISSKFKNEVCNGFYVEVTEWNDFQPVAAGLQILRQAKLSYPKQFEIREHGLLRLLGSRRALAQLMNGSEVGEIAARWRSEADEFRNTSMKYWLY